MVHLLTLAFLGLGVWVIVRDPDSILWWLLGATSLAVGWALRPRLGRLPADAEVLDRASAGELYGAAERVADQVGVKRPRKVAVRDLATRTSYDHVGVARTPVLVVGLPLWLALPPGLRVTLLATAYARLPTGDERVVSEALATLESWRDALLGAAAPLPIREEAQTKIAASSLGAMDHPGTTYEVAGTFGRLIGRVLGGPVLLLRYTLTRLARAGGSRTLARERALALRGESVGSIRQSALAKSRRSRRSRRSRLTDDGVLPSAPRSELLGTKESERIDEELRAHYVRAIRGFGLIS